MTSLISAQLHTMLPKRCFDRPFVCDGLPENCAVIVIGENPALKLGVDWWTFWDDDSGFDLRRFEKLFKEKRVASGKRRPTRDALDRLLNPLREAGLGCLDTNVFRNENPGGHKGGRRKIKNDDVLQTLLAELPQLRTVIAYGKCAKNFMSGQSLPPHVEYFREDHFRNVAHKKIDMLARKILNHQ